MTPRNRLKRIADLDSQSLEQNVRAEQQSTDPEQQSTDPSLVEHQAPATQVANQSSAESASNGDYLKVFFTEEMKLKLIALSDNFRLTLAQINPSKNLDYWKDLTKAQRKAIDNWYRKQRSKVRKEQDENPSEQKAQKEQVPQDHGTNQVIRSFINDDLLEEEMVGILTESIQRSLSQENYNKLCSIQIEDQLRRFAKCDSIGDLGQLLVQIPLEVRLKCSIQLLDKIKGKFQNITSPHIISSTWFEHGIRPALSQLKDSTYEKFVPLTVDEILILRGMCHQANLGSLDDEAAINYLKMLNSAGQLSMQHAFSKFKDKSKGFWRTALKKVSKIKNDKVLFVLVSNQHLICDAVVNAYKLFNFDEKFASALSRFEQGTLEQYSLLHDINRNLNFFTLIDCLPEYEKFEINDFVGAALPLLNNDSEAFRSDLKANLKGRDLSTWHQLQDGLLSCEDLLSNQKGQTKLQEAFSDFEREQQLKPADLPNQQECLDLAFKDLNKKKSVMKCQWQQDIVSKIMQYVCSGEINYLITQIGTGHGKSIMIQQLADSFIHFGKKHVLIVCLNDFLAHYGRQSYGTCNVLNSKVEYLSFQQFLKRTPNSNTIVIFDEIDQMMSSLCFQVEAIKVNTAQKQPSKNNEESKKKSQEHKEHKKHKLDKVRVTFSNSGQSKEGQEEGGNEKMLRAQYVPLLMKEWNTFVGFSGTVSEANELWLKGDFGADIKFLRVPLMRNTNSDHQVKYVIDTKGKDCDAVLLQHLAKIKEDFLNFIVIFQGKQELDTFRSKYELEMAMQFGQADIVYIDNYFTEHFKVTQILERIKLADAFVVLTTRDGSRGIDFRSKGNNLAHVVIVYNPESYGDVMQALGRGMRSLKKHTSGSIVAPSPIETIPSKFLRTMIEKDNQVGISAQTHLKVAKLLHKMKINDGDAFKVRLVKRFQEVINQKLLWENLTRSENDEDRQLWYQLKETFDHNGEMPDEFDGEWLNSQ